MFRRRKSGHDQGKTPSASDAEPDRGDGAPLHSYASQGPSMTNKLPAAPPRPEIPARRLELPGAPKRADSGDGKKLTVGRDIALSGQITRCDKLVVEGTVEADLADAGSIEIAESGLFKGSAAVDEADIAGRFEGELVVRKRLTLRASGQIVGAIRYARLVVEAGGTISGNVTPLAAERPAVAADPAAGLTMLRTP